MGAEKERLADLAVTRRLGLGSVANGALLTHYASRLQQAIQVRLDAVLRPFDLSYARWSVLILLTLEKAEGMPLSTLSGLMDVHPATITKAVTRLEADGLVLRTPHPSNRRVVLCSITPAGLTLVKAATKPVKAVFADLEMLSEEDFATYVRLTEQIRALLTPPAAL